MIAKRVIFEGRVQGVGFRYSVKQLALGFDIVGWVQNLTNGNVELQLMGEKQEVTEFIQEISEESIMSRNITSIHTEEIPLHDGCKRLSH